MSEYTLPFEYNNSQTQSQAQTRYIAMRTMLEGFKGKDQYVVMTPKVGPEAVKCLVGEHAAQVLVDKQGRLATEEEIQTFELGSKLEQQEAAKRAAKTDLSQALRQLTQ